MNTTQLLSLPLPRNKIRIPKMSRYQVGIEFIVDVEAENADDAAEQARDLYHNRDIDFSELSPVIGDYVEEIEDEEDGS